jgi:phosphoenolpyruvate-protein kinase (PTS system EI component)
MHTIHGLPIHEGFVYAKAVKVFDNPFSTDRLNLHANQKDVLDQALSSVSKQIAADIEAIANDYSKTAVLVFEAQKLMVADPFLLDRAYQAITAGKNAYESYQLAANEVISVFEQLSNSYMRDRVVDIEDVTDRVLRAIVDAEVTFELDFSEPRILVIQKLKPSVVAIARHPWVVGIVSAEGSLNQHAARLLQTFEVPGVIIGKELHKINNDDYILINATTGHVFVNPDETIVQQYFPKGGTPREL